MAKFSATNQPSSRGRKPGSRNKRAVFSDAITEEALRQLEAAVLDGQVWAVQEILKRTHPALKPITPADSLDGQMLEAKIFELTELEKRIQALEELGTNGSQH